MQDATNESVANLLERGFTARRADRPEEALEIMTHAVARARELGGGDDLARALKGRGQIVRDEGLRDEALARRLGDRGRERAVERFAPDIIVPRYEHEYERACKN